MGQIGERIREFHQLVPAGVEIVAVSKFHPASMIMEAYDAEQRSFGESRVQEFVLKYEELPKDIKWHFIGHLQTNKVKQVIGKTFLIESVDSLKLLEIINRESEKANVVTKVLLQAHVASEETKFGFFPQELLEIIRQGSLENFHSVEICGLMGMATNTDDIQHIRRDFSTLHNLFDDIKKQNLPVLKNFEYLSMGMSGDWPIAVEEGSNIVRIGSAIFGDRVYT